MSLVCRYSIALKRYLWSQFAVVMLSSVPVASRLMRVFQRSVTQRNVSQRTFYATADAATALAALRKQIETTSIFSATPEANSTNQSCVYVQPMVAASDAA